jgi:hypothetical protein
MEDLLIAGYSFVAALSEKDCNCSAKLHRLNWQRKSVADTPLSLDNLRYARIALKFTPQSQNLHIDAAIENVLVYPSRLQELFSAERTLRRAEKGCQQSIFPLGKGHLRSSGVDKTAKAPIELPAAEFGSMRLRVALRRAARGFLSSQNGADAREEFA